ncbi:MAG: hypothetical protein JJT81_04235 [Rubellimicrobium sp.]|nr:hypothetical protein [Rubellimicrobium sp.]
MTYATVADRDALEAEAAWADRDLPVTVWGLLSRTAATHRAQPAISFQLLSGPGDRTETLSWSELAEQTARTANLFRALGVGETDVVAFVLPN